MHRFYTFLGDLSLIIITFLGELLILYYIFLEKLLIPSPLFVVFSLAIRNFLPKIPIRSSRDIFTPLATSSKIKIQRKEVRQKLFQVFLNKKIPRHVFSSHSNQWHIEYSFYSLIIKHKNNHFLDIGSNKVD